MNTAITPTESQRALLEAAARFEAGAIAVEKPRQPGLSGLVKAGLMIIVPAKDGPDQAIITEEGRRWVVFVDDSPAEPAAADEPPGPYSSPLTAADDPKASKPGSKLQALLDLLQRPEGASIAAMMAATGWQAHSVRGAIAGTIKKKLGHVVDSEKIDGARIYKIAAEAAA
jgi:hypothetical protein